jgi:predicted nucleic acid-binding protein
MPGAEARAAAAVLDASVAVRWVVQERWSEDAADLLARRIGRVAPRLMVAEVAAALRRRAAAVARGLMAPPHG